ncbi:unnamed protein product [Phytophthora fragariaefolia]|uniref:Unnamed protein product n=1 Tax=Phytophthora fragariaefolia TaxID=1490495 RepID=A0A9W6TQ87_9STRA|nr:unnamed protein product [Phytophthora fragariaefolia]
MDSPMPSTGTEAPMQPSQTTEDGEGGRSPECEVVIVVPANSACGLPYRDLIGSLHGVPVAVPANWQCLFLAFFVSVTNVQTKKLTLSAANMAVADKVKQMVLDIVLANLRYDVKLGLVRPKEEPTHIYPSGTPPHSTEAATAMLFAHYTKMRAVSVKTAVPQAFWEVPTVLRGDGGVP